MQSIVNVENDYARVVCSGNFNCDAFIAAYKSGIDSAAAAGFRTLLIDASAVTGPAPTTFERYRIGSAASEYQRRRPSAVVALIGRPPYIDADRFGETVAQNRGGLVRAFTDEQEAMVWLQNVTGSGSSSRTT